MRKSKCPNCKTGPVYNYDEYDPDYPHCFYHINNNCPYKVELFHETEKLAGKLWNEHIKQLKEKLTNHT